MKLLLSNLPKAVIDHRKTVILLSVLFLVVASWKIPSLQFESGVEIWFKKDSSVLRDYQLNEKLFGVSNTMVVSYERQNSDEEKAFLENFTRDMVKHEAVESVDSLLAVEDDVRFRVKYLSKNERYGLVNLELKLTKENNHKFVLLPNTSYYYYLLCLQVIQIGITSKYKLLLLSYMFENNTNWYYFQIQVIIIIL